MVFLHILASSTLNFRYLTLFLCHLFADGSFQTAQIVYDSNVFNENCLTQIQSTCFNSIALKTADINQPFTLPLIKHNRGDDVLQLIFFDSNHLGEKIDQFKDLLNSYCVFVFPLTDDTNAQEQYGLINNLNSMSNKIALVLHYNVNKGTVYVYHDEKSAIITFDQDCGHDGVNFFDQTFGEYKRKRSIAAQHASNSEDAVVQESSVSFRNMYEDSLYHNMTLIVANVEMLPPLCTLGVTPTGDKK